MGLCGSKVDHSPNVSKQTEETKEDIRPIERSTGIVLAQTLHNALNMKEASQDEAEVQTGKALYKL